MCEVNSRASTVLRFSYMALNTMEKLYAALRDLEPRIEIEESLRLAAKKSLDRMLEMASGTIGKGDLGRV